MKDDIILTLFFAFLYISASVIIRLKFIIQEEEYEIKL